MLLKENFAYTFTIVKYFSNALAYKVDNQKQGEIHSHFCNHTVLSYLSSLHEGNFTILMVPGYQDDKLNKIQKFRQEAM